MDQTLKIDNELRDLFPHLTPDEFNQLEQNILRDGCTSPLCTWNGYIVDGHNRYKICTKHNIEFKTFPLSFRNKEEVISWMVDTQLGRRNLTQMQKIDIAEKYRPVYEKENKEKNGGFKGNQHTSGSVPKLAPDQKTKTRDALANLAGVSHGTYDKAKKILDLEKENGDNLTPEQKEIISKVRSGEKKINTAYKELFKPESTGDKSKADKSSLKGESKGSKSGKEDTKPSDPEPTIEPKTECEPDEPLTNSEPEIDPTPEPTSEPEVDSEQEPEPEPEAPPSPTPDPAQEQVLKQCEIDKNLDESPSKPLASESDQDKLRQEIIKDIKTPKNAQDHMNVEHEIVWTEFVCNDLVKQLDRKFFSLHDLSRKMNREQIEKTVGILDKHILEIKCLVNKFTKPKEPSIHEELTKITSDLSRRVSKLTDTSACDELLLKMNKHNEDLARIKKEIYYKRNKLFHEMPKNSKIICRIEEEDQGTGFNFFNINFYMVKASKKVSNDTLVLSINRYILVNKDYEETLEERLKRCKTSSKLNDIEFNLLCMTVYNKRKMEIRYAEEEELRKKEEELKRKEESDKEMKQLLSTMIKQVDPNVKNMMVSIVNQGFRELARKHHPDVSHDDGQKMVLVSQAKEVLDAII